MRKLELIETFLFKNIHTLIVRQQGEFLIERYFSGEDNFWGEPTGKLIFNPESLHDVRSVSKSIVAILYGIAMEEGLTRQVGSSLSEVYSDYSHLQAVRNCSIQHVLTMTGGLQWYENVSYDNHRNDEIAMELAPDRIGFIFSKFKHIKVSRKWNYSGGYTALLGDMIERATRAPLSLYAREVLFDPLGIDNYSWYKGNDGVDSAASGLRLRARDLLKVGDLILNNGCYNGIQVIPENWLKKMLRPRVKTDDSYFCAYGYQWYTSGYYDSERSIYHRWHAALGNGGQMLFLCPSLQAVVVINSGRYNDNGVWLSLEKLLNMGIIPALIKNFNLY